MSRQKFQLLLLCSAPLIFRASSGQTSHNTSLQYNPLTVFWIWKSISRGGDKSNKNIAKIQS